MNRLLPRDSGRRTAAYAVVGTALVLFFTQIILPGGVKGQHGTPGGVLFKGTVFGALNALTAIGIVLIYRTSRIINFSQAALGAAGAVFTYNFVTVLHWPYGVAFVLGVLIAAVVGLAVEMFLRKFFNAPRLVLTIVTIGVAGLLALAPATINGLTLWGEDRSLLETVGATDVFPLKNWQWHCCGFPQPFNAAHIMAVVVVALALLGVGAFLRFTRMGIAVRASSENAERAQLLGINVRILSTVVWTIAGALSGAGVILYASVTSFTVAGQGSVQVLIASLAAAVLARMRSLSLAALVALAIAVLQESVKWSYAGQDILIDAALFGVILLGLIAQRRELQRGEAEVSSWEATEEIRPTPREMLQVSGVRLWRWVLIGVGGAFLLLLPWISSTGQTNLGGVSAIMFIVLLSIVVLTGWAGQVSLGQFAFVAIGAVVGGALMSKAGLSFWLALPAGSIVTALVAVGVGLPALRIKGLYLGIATLAFAFATNSVLFSEKYFKWLLPSSVERPTLLLIDFDDERSMYYLTVAVAALCVLVVVGLRRTRPGRVLIALRENESDLQSFGVNVVRTKLAAFALAGFLAGLAGVLYAAHQRAVTQTSFQAQESIDLFVFAVIGGISSVSGAALGAGFRALKQFFPGDPITAFFVNANFGLLVILYVAPGGLAGIVFSIRDQILRIVALRRGMVVPSLFADYDPDALERKLIPLGETLEGAGLGALDGRRYRMTSELYDRGIRDGADHAPDERAALAAAAASSAREELSQTED
jgi:branched-chain amino acid transport system permease protein